MNHNSLNGVLFGSMICLLLACNNKKEESSAAVVDKVDKEQIKKEIQAKEDEFAATYNASVLKDIGYYADDAISFYQNRPALVGKEAIIEFLKADLATNTKNKISFKTQEVFVSSDGNLVVELGHFTVIDSTNMGINKGNYMSLFEKRNGKYVCVRDMSASDVVLPDQ
jgi:ketosteroid isomerase-like protein